MIMWFTIGFLVGFFTAMFVGILVSNYMNYEARKKDVYNYGVSSSDDQNDSGGDT